MAQYLEERGKRVRIANLALRMLTEKRFDVPRFLERQNPKLIGIDLHWMPHCHGAVEIARLAKAAHPDVPVVFGGLSSTYFHEQLLEYPEIDFVLRGDSTEPPLLQLMETLENGGSLEDIPNLSWRDGQGEVRVNPLSFVPKTLDYVDVHPERLIEMAIRYQDLAGVLPYAGWLRNPTTMVLPLKGCAYHCTTCGASNDACSHLTLRKRPVFRSPANLAENVARIARLSRGTIVIPGDLLQGGLAYATEVVDEIAARGVKNDVMFEFFDVPPIEFLRHIDATLHAWSFEVSPESHDPSVRHALEGEDGYENPAMERLLEQALELSPTRIDVFYMIGLQYQTYESVMQTVDYCERLFAKGDKRLQAFISPMGPFLDPASRIFEEPERFGYTKLAHTLEEHRQLLDKAPSWEHILNYETEWMTREQLVDATYDAAERLNEFKRRYGYISERQADRVAEGIAGARALRERLADRLEHGDPADDPELRGDIARFSHSTVGDKRELFWQRHLISFRLPALARAALRALRPGAAARDATPPDPPARRPTPRGEVA
jgi:B12-binding domain/radical SAM domain protein